MLETRCGVSSLSGLRALDVSGLGLTSFGDVFAAPDGPLAALTSLAADGNQLTSLAPLAGLRQLAVLSLKSNGLGDTHQQQQQQAGSGTLRSGSSGGAGAGGGVISFAAPATHPDAQLQSLLPGLRELHLASNGMTTLAGSLQLGCALSGLRSLNVQDNALTSLEGLGGLHQLRELAVERNRIRVLHADVLSGLCRLRVLRLDNNRLADPWDAADKLATLPSLAAVWLPGNPLARRQVHRTLLIARCCRQLGAVDGVEVSEEERAWVAEASLQQQQQPSPPSAAAAGGGGGAGGAPMLLGRCWQGADLRLAPGSAGAAPADAAAALLMAVADSRAGGGSPLAAAGSSSSRGRAAGSPRPTALAPAVAHQHRQQQQQQAAGPAVLSYEALASLAARHGIGSLSGGAGGVVGPGGAMFQASVPSIQSGVLLLTGAASFGLAGTGIVGASGLAGSSSNGGGLAAASRLNAGKRLAPAKPQQPPSSLSSLHAAGSRRVTTGSVPVPPAAAGQGGGGGGVIASARAGGFVVRQ